ncbi:MAG: hypothetical protein QOJ63_394 [Solirubrobacteraceae bacterium]|jgi:hypothetical protein|nr:hypothetical protein [Solirubrobacteraceae bacterium]
MGAMAGRRAHLAAIPALLLAGCESSGAAPLPAACLGEPAAIVRALERAPAAATLPDGTPLSRCVRLARGDGELQELGVSLMQVADGLRARAVADPVVALRLGYLVGAVRRGAAATPGIAAQLARRVEQAAALDDAGAGSRAALARGISLGEAGG